MPARNRIKDYAPEAYYHIYNRGVNKQLIFEEDEDYVVFLNLLKRYLGTEKEKDNKNRDYPSYASEIDLLAFCLMPNHFHLLVYQNNEPQAIEKLMRSLVTTYSMYFNRKYKRIGHLFQGAYKASLINDVAYLEHISRYIHLNPYEWERYKWSSLPYYLGDKHANWVKPHKILEIFEGDSYYDFVANYEDYKKELDDLKHVLAEE